MTSDRPMKVSTNNTTSNMCINRELINMLTATWNTALSGKGRARWCIVEESNRIYDMLLIQRPLTGGECWNVQCSGCGLMLWHAIVLFKYIRSHYLNWSRNFRLLAEYILPKLTIQGLSLLVVTHLHCDHWQYVSVVWQVWVDGRNESVGRHHWQNAWPACLPLLRRSHSESHSHWLVDNDASEKKCEYHYEKIKR